MRKSIKTILGGVVGLVGVVVWAVVLTSFAPDISPAGPDGQIAMTLSDWPRDLRGTAVLLAIGGLLLACQASSRSLLAAGVGFVLWFGADIVLHRAHVSGTRSGLIVGVTAVVAYISALIACRHDGVPRGPLVRRVVLLVIASIGGALGLFLSGVDWSLSPDAHGAKAVFGLLVAALAVLSVGAALAAAPAITPLRGAIAVGVVAMLIAMPLWLHGRWDGMLAMLFGIVVVSTSVLLLAGAWGGGIATWGSYVVVAVIAPIVGVGVVVAVIALPGVDLASWLTALAHDPPLNTADINLVLPVMGLASGLATAVPVAVAAVRPSSLLQSSIVDRSAPATDLG